MASPALIDYMVCLNGLNLILNEHYQVIFKAFATLESEEDYQKALFHYLTKSAEMVNSDMVVANEQKELLLSANDIWDRETRHLLRKQVKREINYLRRFNTTRRTLHMIHHPKVNLSIYNSHYDKDGLHVNGRIEGIDPIDSLFGVWATNILTFENHRRR